MADYGSFSDDISKLWGPDVEGGLIPAPPAPVPTDDAGPVDAAFVNGNGNGHGTRVTVVGNDVRDDVNRLAEALAAAHADVVHRADLDAVRVEMEGAFTHQVAVALYELMTASNARFATAEDHINQRVAEAVERHTNRLETSFQKHHRAAMELSEFLWAEMDAIRQRLSAPLDGLVSFQRELRHEVGRLGDIVSAATEAAGRAEAETQRQAGAGVELAQRLERSEAQAAMSSKEMSEISSALSSVRDDVASLRLEIAELRQALDPGPKARGRRWSRNR